MKEPTFPGQPEVSQILPEKKRMPLNGLYLNHKLAELSNEIGRPIVLTAYLTDKNGIVAQKNKKKRFVVPPEIKNPADWHLFQELMAQADLVITGSAYLRSLAVLGNNPQDVLFGFGEGKEFEGLGDWRLKAGFERRFPDLAVVTHRLDFQLPAGLLDSGRRIFIFTSDPVSASSEAIAFGEAGALVIGCGPDGVDGDRMIATLEKGWGYNVIMMTTGPCVLDILLSANRLDLLYVTEAQVELANSGPGEIRKILPGKSQVKDLPNFTNTHSYLQEEVVTDAGSRISQLFLRYDRKDIIQ